MQNEQIKQIKADLTNGVQYGNDLENWVSLVNVEKNQFILMINDQIKVYKNLDSVSKRINKLLKSTKQKEMLFSNLNSFIKAMDYEKANPN